MGQKSRSCLPLLLHSKLLLKTFSQFEKEKKKFSFSCLFKSKQLCSIGFKNLPAHFLGMENENTD